jgi:hypothetical protein
VEGNPGLEAKTIFEALQRKYTGELADGQLRTRHVPGRLGQSDFTHMTELEITIGWQSFPHLLCSFVLAYPNGEDATVCYSESFESLSEGLQNGLYY